MNFLTENQDFITKTVGDNPNYHQSLFIFFGIAAVLSIVVLIVSIKFNWAAPGLISSILLMLSAIILSINFVFSVQPVSAEKFDVPAFQTWASETYLIDVNDKQAESLLENVTNGNEASAGNSVLVESFNGSNVLVSLYKNDSGYSLFITENLAVVSH